MSITDELREWAHGFTDLYVSNERQLIAIADRIDEQHKHAVMSAMNDALYHANDESMAELGWVRLPKDADGEVIHIGDRVENNERVVRIVLTDGIWEPSVYVEKRPNVLREYFCNEISHYHEPTVEDVLTKMLEQAVGYSDAHTTVAANAIAEYAAKLRLAGEGE